MKRIILLSLAVFLFLPVAVYASSIGGAETQGQGKFSISFDQEFMFHRDIEDETVVGVRGFYYTTVTTATDIGDTFVVDIGGVTGDLKLSSEMDKAKRSMVRLNYGLLDNLDIFAKFGVADYNLKGKGRIDIADQIVTGFPTTGDTVSITDTREEMTVALEGEKGFAWAVGMRGIHPLDNGWLLGMQAQYLRQKNTLETSMAGRTRGSFEVTGGPRAGQTGTWKTEEQTRSMEWEATIEEWHIAPYIAKRLGSLTPYLGVRYSEQVIEIETGGGSEINLEADDNFGVFLGTDFKVGEKFSLNLEARFIDETAISFGGTFRF